MESLAQHRTRVLWLTGGLHAFTHVYQVLLLPLYFLIQEDLKLESVGRATLLQTVMMVAYFVPSYPMGILADRFSKKNLLTWGLAINGLGFVCLGFAPGYAMAIASLILAGIGGSFFHPAATALVAGLFPKDTGRALGFIGIGAVAGFFFGPIYAGWRSSLAGSWRTPVIELGVAGIVGAIVFAWLAEESPEPAGTHQDPPGGTGPALKLFPSPVAWAFFLMASVAFSLRDFTGSSMGSLGSLFLQSAHHWSPRETGMGLSGIFIAAVISNPLFGHLSDRGRNRWTFAVMGLAAAAVAVFPRLPAAWLPWAFMVYGFFFMASYPMVEANLMQAVPAAVRGRVFGLFITVGGLMGNVSHWFVGQWVEGLGPQAQVVSSYYGIYATLGGLVVAATAGLWFLSRLRALTQRTHFSKGSAEARGQEPRVRESGNQGIGELGSSGYRK